MSVDGLSTKFSTSTVEMYINLFSSTVFFKQQKKTNHGFRFEDANKKTTWCLFPSNMMSTFVNVLRMSESTFKISPYFLWLQHMKIVLMLEIWCNSKSYKALPFAA